MKAFHIENRQKIISSLKPNSLAVVFSGKSVRSSADAHHAFVVNRNFFYLTGLKRENFVLVMSNLQGEVTAELFIEKPDYDVEKWVGRKMKKAQAEAISGIAKISYVEDFDKAIVGYAAKPVEHVYTDFDRFSWQEPDMIQHAWAKDFSARFPHVKIENLQPLMINARMIKTAYEIEQIRKAIAYTKTGLEKLMHKLAPDLYEYQLNSLFTHSITNDGSAGNSFPTIAAGGENAVILHYVENDQALKDGDLVLLDLGALENNYASDISRTYPVNGKYSDRQRQLYNIVLGARAAVLEIMVPGTPFADLNNTCIAYLTKALKEIGLIERDEELGKYYYHGVSHHLGLDVHDISDRTRPLEAGMVLTVEPGLYIAEEGIGIRIEDDVLVTAEGNEVLSQAIIRTVEDIEAFMAKK